MKRHVQRWSRVLPLTASLLALGTAPAWGQSSEPASETSSDGAWARGVPMKSRQQARSLFLEGNKALEDSAYGEAAESYRQALQLWNHPAIHYNLALALTDFDQPVEVYHHMSEATRYGKGPLDEGKYNHALEVKERIEKKMTWLDVSCAVPGAQVSLDGKPLFQAPNHFKGLVQPGVHSLVASKPGLVTLDKDHAFTMAGGGRMNVDLKLYNPAELTQNRTRWAPWMPWSIVGSGLAVAAGGGLLQWQTQKTYHAVDEKVVACNGCMPTSEINSLRTRGDNLQRAAVGAYALGGAGLVAGVALLFLNQPRPYFVNPETGEASLSLAPLIGSAPGVQATLHH